MYHFTTQWNTHFILSSSWLHVLMLSFCWSRQYVWFLKAGCSIKSCHPLLMLLKLELLPSPSRIPIQCCKRYGGMLKIGLLPSRSTDSPLKILGYISSVRGSLLTAIMVLALVNEYMSRSYSWSSHVICITPILDYASEPVLCPLAEIHKSCASIE